MTFYDFWDDELPFTGCFSGCFLGWDADYFLKDVCFWPSCGFFSLPMLGFMPRGFRTGGLTTGAFFSFAIGGFKARGFNGAGFMAAGCFETTSYGFLSISVFATWVLFSGILVENAIAALLPCTARGFGFGGCSWSFCFWALISNSIWTRPMASLAVSPLYLILLIALIWSPVDSSKSSSLITSAGCRS